MNGTGGGNWQRIKFKRVVTGGDKMLNDGMDGEHFGYYYFANYTSIDFDILILELSRLIVSGFERISKSIYKSLEGIISCAFFCLKWGCFSLEERPPWLLICLPKARPLEVDYLWDNGRDWVCGWKDGRMGWGWDEGRRGISFNATTDMFIWHWSALIYPSSLSFRKLVVVLGWLRFRHQCDPLIKDFLLFLTDVG